MVQLRYFASLRERLGIGEETVSLPVHVNTVAGLQLWLQERGTLWAETLADQRLLVAVNHEISERNASVSDGDEIAWLPPVTGG